MMNFGTERFRPAQQGEHDGFCGVYTLTNYFARRLGVAGDSDCAGKVFRDLVHALDRRGRLTPRRVAGTGFLEGQLQKAFNEVAQLRRIPVQAWALGSYCAKHDFSNIRDLLLSLNYGEAAMVHMDERQHWVLAHNGVKNGFWVDDSSGAPRCVFLNLREIERHQIGIKHGLVLADA